MVAWLAPEINNSSGKEKLPMAYPNNHSIIFKQTKNSKKTHFCTNPHIQLVNNNEINSMHLFFFFFFSWRGTSASSRQSLQTHTWRVNPRSTTPPIRAMYQMIQRILTLSQVSPLTIKLHTNRLSLILSMKLIKDYDSHGKIITVEWSTSIIQLIKSIKLIDLKAQLNQPYIKIIVDWPLR